MTQIQLINNGVYNFSCLILLDLLCFQTIFVHCRWRVIQSWWLMRNRDIPKQRENDLDVRLIYHRLTVAKRTVISSGLPPSVSIPAARALTENGDKNWNKKKMSLNLSKQSCQSRLTFGSLDSRLAIRAIVFAHCWSLTSSLQCCSTAISWTRSLSGTLSKRPSVARRITSPSSTLNSYWSADSGLSANTLTQQLSTSKSLLFSVNLPHSEARLEEGTIGMGC